MDGLQNFLNHSGSLCQPNEDIINSQVTLDTITTTESADFNATAAADFGANNGTADFSAATAQQLAAMGGSGVVAINSTMTAACAEVSLFLYSNDFEFY